MRTTIKELEKKIRFLEIAITVYAVVSTTIFVLIALLIKEISNIIL